jgi:hypothetical protein
MQSQRPFRIVPNVIQKIKEEIGVHNSSKAGMSWCDLIMNAALSNLASFWNLLLFFAAAGVLVLFFYSFFLRKLFRARRIANLRSRRDLRDASRR